MPAATVSPVTIRPEIGRTLYFYPSARDPLPGSPGPLAAKVVYVHSATCINCVVWDSNGDSHQFQSVKLIHPGDAINPGEQHAAWMPFQVEAAERNQPKTTSPQSAAEQAARAAANMESLRQAQERLRGTLPGPGKDSGPATISTLPTAPEKPEGEQVGNTKEECGKQPAWLKK